MKQCEFLLDICRNCKKSYRRDERYLTCIECGEDRQCGFKASTGSRFCYRHGAPNQKAKFSGMYVGRPMVTGKQSRSLIPRMASKYMEQTKDSMYILNKKSIDLLDARIIDLLDRTDAEASPERIERIAKYWKELNLAVPGLKYDVSDDKAAYRAYTLLDDEIEAAYHDYAAWKQIFEALELRRKHTESEMKILKDMKTLMTAEDGMELVAQLFAAIMKVLKDEPKGHHLINLIRIEFDRITGATTVGETETRSGEVVDI
jgi:hypothetical protein